MHVWRSLTAVSIFHPRVQPQAARRSTVCYRSMNQTHNLSSLLQRHRQHQHKSKQHLLKCTHNETQTNKTLSYNNESPNTAAAGGGAGADDSTVAACGTSATIAAGWLKLTPSRAGDGGGATPTDAAAPAAANPPPAAVVDEIAAAPPPFSATTSNGPMRHMKSSLRARCTSAVVWSQEMRRVSSGKKRKSSALKVPSLSAARACAAQQGIA